jgi:hypothetical protein
MGSTSPTHAAPVFQFATEGCCVAFRILAAGGSLYAREKSPPVPGNLLDLAAVKSREWRRFGSCSPEGLAPGNGGPQTPTKGASEVLKRGAVYCRGADDEPPQSRHQCWQKFSAEFFPDIFAQSCRAFHRTGRGGDAGFGLPHPLSAYQAGLTTLS